VYTLALSGCNLLLQPVASSLNAVEGEHSNPTGWQINIRHTAMTWGMYVVMVNRVGKERGATFFGQSSVIDPYGNCLLQLGEQSELGIVDIELAETSRAQKNLPTLRDAAPELIAQLIKKHLNG
jgi:predicted amidohydrolase